MLFAQVDTQCPSRREHQVEDAKTEREEYEHRHLSRDKSGQEHTNGRDRQRRGTQRLTTNLNAIAMREFIGQMTAGNITYHAHDKRHRHRISQFVALKTTS